MSTGGHEPTPGNADFNLTGVTPSKTIGIEPAHKETATAEDIALDMQLEAMISAQASAETHGQSFHDPDEPANVTPTKAMDDSQHLSSMQEGYKPAKSLAELDEQISFAKEYGCDSVDVEENFAKQLRRRDFKDIERDGYWCFKGVKVHLPGRFAKSRARDCRTIYDKEYRETNV